MGLPENPDTGFGCSKGITLSASISTVWFAKWEGVGSCPKMVQEPQFKTSIKKFCAVIRNYRHDNRFQRAWLLSPSVESLQNSSGEREYHNS